MIHQQPQYQPYQWQLPPAVARVGTGVLVGVSVWRLLIVASAFIGFFAAMSRGKAANLLPALSQQASLLTGVVYTGLLLVPLFTSGRRHEPLSPWWRGAMLVLLVLVCVTYIAIIGGDLDSTWSLFEHLITPLLVLIDFVAVGRNQVAVKWWHPIAWLAFPLAYLVYYVSAGLRLYGSFLDPSKSSFPGVIAGFVAALLALGFVLYAIGRVKRSVLSQAPPGRPQQQPYPQPVPPQQYAQPFPAPPRQPPPAPPYRANR